MQLIRQVWTSTGSSGGLASVFLGETPRDVALFLAHSTLATTQSASLQTAINSSGPWFLEGSTQISTAVSTAFKLAPTGPLARYARPYLHTASTGAYDFLLVGSD